MERAFNLPGRANGEERTLETDQRLDPRLVKIFAALGLSENQKSDDVLIPSEHIHHVLSEMEQVQAQMLNAMTEGEAKSDGIVRSEVNIKGEQGNDIKLFLHQPESQRGSAPCIYHMHGGGMAILRAEDSFNALLRDRIAELGFLVVGVEFRNSSGAFGPFPFPAGLNDCFAGLQWLSEKKSELKISKIILAGESGGANLALATCLKAKQDRALSMIDGVYVMCPFIFNASNEPAPQLMSKWENADYFLNAQIMSAIATAYDPKGEHSDNPLCWPYEASADDLASLPPHSISVNELDPLRDEGLQYYRNLMAAGVLARSRTINGTSHAADLMFPGVIPELFQATLNDMRNFANSL